MHLYHQSSGLTDHSVASLFFFYQSNLLVASSFEVWISRESFQNSEKTSSGERLISWSKMIFQMEDSPSQPAVFHVQLQHVLSRSLIVPFNIAIAIPDQSPGPSSLISGVWQWLVSAAFSGRCKKSCSLWITFPQITVSRGCLTNPASLLLQLRMFVLSI